MIDEGIQRCWNSDTALRLGSTQLPFQQVGICRVYLQPQFAFTTPIPSLAGFLPSEIIYPHTFEPVTTNSKFVGSAFRTKVQVRYRVFEDSSRSSEVLESSRFAGRNWRSTNEVKFPVCGYPVDHRRLNELVPINH
jgi:hypothetical protein